MREKILTFIERNSRVDFKELAIILGSDGKRKYYMWLSYND